MIKVEDIVYARFRAPDLDKMENFLVDFGMQRYARTETALFMRGVGADPILHVTELGEPGFVGLALQASSEADLNSVAEANGVSVEARTEPGGGKRALVHDPDGFPIEVLHGLERLDVAEVQEIAPLNARLEKPRLGDVKRMAAGPAHVHRLGHLVLNVTDYQKSFAWYHEQFGLLKSDEIYVGDENTVIGAFTRCDQGEKFVDHHTLFLLGTGKPGFNHAAWEVADLDDLMLGRDVLTDKGHKSVWGVGRHILGSQVFDYWRDPWGHTVEHWTDGDLFNASTPPGKASLDELLGQQWGPGPLEDMAG
ncbi:MAG: VOC family protein [Parvibaculaceae bacterium]|nr:VOC family protein [Parvibaculaceae bacterium]